MVPELDTTVEPAAVSPPGVAHPVNKPMPTMTVDATTIPQVFMPSPVALTLQTQSKANYGAGESLRLN
jgi:hypothetical protein